jgi:ABC-type transporter Mla MlaB component
MIPANRLKIHHAQQHGSGTGIEILGIVDSSSCDCLLHFWSKHLENETGPLSIDMRQVESIDAASIAELCSLIRHRAARQQITRLIAPPQMLAHTLYKVASLRDQGRVILEEPRDEEPYAG